MPAIHAQFSRLDDQDERAKAIRVFHTLVLADPEATAAGRQIVKSARNLLAPGKSLEIMADTPATSRTGTLAKHASALWRFAAFLQPRGIASPFLADEDSMYQYLCHLRKNKAGATSGSTFLSAFRFSAVTFGLVTPLDTLDSKRVKGVAHDMYLRKPPRKPAPPLTVAAIKHLISLVLNQAIPKHVRLIAGHLFFGNLRSSSLG